MKTKPSESRRSRLKKKFCGSLRLCALCVLSLLPVTTNNAAEKPNLLFIFLDDFGWKDTSYMGSDFYETPHLDKLASEGMIFTDAYSCAANCAGISGSRWC